MLIAQFQYDQHVYTMPRLLKFFETEAPPDDISIIFNDAIDAFISRLHNEDIQPAFYRTRQVIVIYPHTIKTVGMMRNTKLVGRFKRRADTGVFYGNISIGLTNEINRLLDANVNFVNQHTIVEIENE